MLFRINAQSEVYEQALAECRRARTCCAAASGSSTGPRSARRGCCCAARPGPTTTACRWPRRCARCWPASGWHADTPPPGGAARERWESLAALVSLAERPGRRAARRPDLAEFVAELDQRAAAQHAPTVQGVTLASLHSAKGLEWDAVFLVGLTDQTLPIQHADHARAAGRGAAAVLRRHHPGPRAAGAVLGAGPQSRAAPRAPARAGSSTGCGPTGRTARRPSRGGRSGPRREAADAELFGRLRAWRKAQADAQKVPAYVVFSDATLVGDRRSRGRRSRAALARISGVGPTKLERYAEPVLAVLGGANPDDVVRDIS